MNWISVKDKLPNESNKDECVWVLVCNDKKAFTIAQWSCEKWIFYYANDPFQESIGAPCPWIDGKPGIITRDNITHWMRIT